MEILESPLNYTVFTHPKVEEAIAHYSLGDTPANELRLLYHANVIEGCCSFHNGRLEATSTSTCRKALAKAVHCMVEAGLLKKVRNYRQGERCNIYRFTLGGENYDGRPDPTDVMKSVVRYDGVVLGRCVIDGEWMRKRGLDWASYALSRGMRVAMDYCGRTFMGQAVRRAMAAINVPFVPQHVIDAIEDDDERKWTVGFLKRIARGAIPRCFKKKGRLYHYLSAMPKFVRGRVTFDYLGRVYRAATVDMSTTFFTILVGDLEECEEKRRLVDIIQNGDIYTCLSDGDRDVAKEQFQKQCLFWRTTPERLRPMWVAMKSLFPKFCQHILDMRRMYGVQNFAVDIMKREGSMFVDQIMRQVDELGIPCLLVHDGCVVPDIEQEVVKEIMQKVTGDVLGFTPSVKITVMEPFAA